ncbi:MAG: zinc ribbon domain-containing protein [Labilithrix sp.]|nr:zinc ribbon domain-containing protein [Labilithrix sp.]
MSDASLTSGTSRDDAPSDEQRIARAVAIGLPLVTLAAASIVGVVVGPATSILVLAAGLLLGVIALLWNSLRVLSGDAELSPELEALDMAAQGVDALSSRKTMLLRALKDLENERAIGKLEEDDFEQLSSTYRAELKAVLRRIDDSLAPHRAKAEEAAREHLARAGVVAPGGRGALPDENTAKGAARDAATKPAKGSTKRVACPKCGESNEPDAKFCKECATRLSPASTSSVPAAVATSNHDSDEDDDEDSHDA